MQSNGQVQLFPFGPLHANRLEINEKIKPHIKTGDIFYRASNAKGPFGIPFSTLVQFLTGSKYSHAAVALSRDDDLYLLEVSDQGTVLCRFVDWLDYCSSPEFSVYRLKEYPPDFEKNINKQIQDILDLDPDYNFDFSDPDKVYCTECVANIYKGCGVDLIKPQIIRNIVPKWTYAPLVIGDFIVSHLSNCSLPFNKPLYYVGNQHKGMISSKKTEIVLHYVE